MKEGGGSLAKFIFTVVLLMALIHTPFHIATYGTGIKNFGEHGFSGFSIGKKDIGEELKNSYPLGQASSKYVVIAEWVAVLFTAAMLITRRRKITKEEPAPIKMPQIEQTKLTTDLDKVCAILKERKRIRVSALAKLFGVSKETILEWGTILESGNLVRIEYPALGEPEFVDKQEK